jgi:hypothetical protein
MARCWRRRLSSCRCHGRRNRLVPNNWLNPRGGRTFAAKTAICTGVGQRREAKEVYRVAPRAYP